MPGLAYFSRFMRDDRGAYAVATAMAIGLLALMAHITFDSLRVQNSKTGAEQLVDIACQKIQRADPALYPGAKALKSAIEAQMAKRSIAGTDASNGQLTIEASAPDPAYRQPITGFENYSDLRRFTFTVRYEGQVSGLHANNFNEGKTAVTIEKPCRPTCPGISNIIYSSAAAAGHWLDGSVLKVAQEVDSNDKLINKFEPVIFADPKDGNFQSGDRYVLTIFNPDDNTTIRYRKIFSIPSQIYVDSDRYSSPGEPAVKNGTRLTADDNDQLMIQKLNADGSIPGMCGDVIEPPPPDCIGDCPCEGEECKVCVGPNCLQSCTFEEPFPAKRPFDKIRWLRPKLAKVTFEYPANDGKPGQAVVIYDNKRINIRLAPFYVKNTIPITLLTKYDHVTLPSEHWSAYGLFTQTRWNILKFPQHRYVVHMAGTHYFWFWDGNDKCTTFRSPIVFDTKGLGTIPITELNDHSPFFDYYGKGRKKQVEWPTGDGVAWLVDNRDGRAAVDMTGLRLFGDLHGHDNGYEMLAELDTSGTGILRGRDLDGLALWFDNGNAIVDEGELRSLKDVGVTEIDTRWTSETFPNGRAYLRSSAMIGDRQIMTADIFIEVLQSKVDKAAHLSKDLP